MYWLVARLYEGESFLPINSTMILRIEIYILMKELGENWPSDSNLVKTHNSYNPYLQFKKTHNSYIVVK